VKGYAATRSRPLTPRMRQVLAAAAAGRTAAETAAELGVAPATVWSIRAALCDRLDVHTVTAAVLVAVRRGDL
jgi:DNA-binding NarL/FixJ family response regulator